LKLLLLIKSRFLKALKMERLIGFVIIFSARRKKSRENPALKIKEEVRKLRSKLSDLSDLT